MIKTDGNITCITNIWHSSNRTLYKQEMEWFNPSTMTGYGLKEELSFVH